tara:strand:- start:1367 stop:1855 length:489 start_codon:yes stop_codon:yes gene_type:complete
MKITKTQLKQIIKEEIHKVLSEAPTSQFADPEFAKQFRTGTGAFAGGPGSADIPDPGPELVLPNGHPIPVEWKQNLPYAFEAARMLAAKEGSIPSELSAAALEELNREYDKAISAGDLPSAGGHSCALRARGYRSGSPEMRSACKEEDAAYILHNLLSTSNR